MCMGFLVLPFFAILFYLVPRLYSHSLDDWHCMIILNIFQASIEKLIFHSSRKMGFAAILVTIGTNLIFSAANIWCLFRVLFDNGDFPQSQSNHDLFRFLKRWMTPDKSLRLRYSMPQTIWNTKNVSKWTSNIQLLCSTTSTYSIFMVDLKSKNFHMGTHKGMNS